MRRRNRKSRQMTPLEASQRAVMFMIETLNGGAATKKKRRRNRGAARRAKIEARRHRLYVEEIRKAPRALALAHAYNKMVEARRMEHARQ